MKFRDEVKWIIPVLLVCIVFFANSLFGEFVYDDMRQILRNPLIQDNSLIWKALTSDVWAFKGDGTIAASNYWRPAFTAWHILNFRLFGENPFGWHLLNLLLHIGVCVLAYINLRRWEFSAAIACVITLIFAVHPVHVESVSWVSGSPDLLFTLAFLASLWFAQTFAETKKTKYLALSLALYALALGAKEIGILCLLVYYFVFTGRTENKSKPGEFNLYLVSYGAVAALYFIVRMSLLGGVARPPEDAASFGQALLSVPEIFAFYLRQIFFPYWMSPNYPLQPVSQIGAMNFILPLVVSLAALAAIFLLARRAKTGLLAAALFFLPLLPAMNATAFISDQIVHDRYLYLPLLGFLMLIVPFAAGFLKENYLLPVCAVLALILGVQTFLYNRAWENDLTLWTRAAAVDNSAFTMAQYGSELSDKGRIDEAIQIFTRSIEAKPTARGYLGRGRNYLTKKQYANAEKDLTAVLQMPLESLDAYALYQTYEAAGLAGSEQGKFDAAIENFKEARKKLPIYAASLTTKLAIVLYQKGQKAEALAELESAKAQARKELLPESKAVFFRLGMLYAELGRKEDARAALQEYLKLTDSVKSKTVATDRADAVKLLQSLK